jgi:uracil phosphoribosyltransferase
MRDKNTGAKDFRELVNEVAMLMTYEATRDLPLREVTVETPIAVAKTKIIAGRKVAFVPIMRAGLGMLDGANALVPAAKVGHIGICRTKDNNGSECYYCKLPFDINERDVVVLDLMLATGMSAIGALEKIYESGAKTVKFVCVAASPEGVKAVQDAYPDVEIYTGALDAGLNEEQYITPGLGDGGDRIYGTK